MVPFIEPYRKPNPPIWSPLDIPNLWGWWKAGTNGENVTTSPGPNGPLIDLATDISGNGHDLTGVTNLQPGYRKGLNLPASSKGGAYHTSKGLLGLHRWPDGVDHFNNVYDHDSLSLTGAFFLSVVFTNTRPGGQREAFGRSTTNRVRIDQDREDVHIRIAGGSNTEIVNGLLPLGICHLEILRDASNIITVYGNRQNITKPGLSAYSGTLTLTGFGWDSAAMSSHFDDYLMEILIANGAVPDGPRNLLEKYLAEEWEIV